MPSAPGKSDAEALQLKEWEAAREVIAKGDERLQTIRQGGFTLVTTVVTASTLFLRDRTSATPWTAASVTAISTLLIVTMCLIEHITRSLQSAASMRARVLERQLGLELTDTISDRHEREDWPRHFRTIYILFVIASACAGAAVSGTLLAAAPCGAVAVMGSLGIWWYSHRQVPQYVDWSLERTDCVQGETVRISVTIFDPPRRPSWYRIDIGQELWKVVRNRPGDGSRGPNGKDYDVVYCHKATTQDLHRPYRTWLIDASQLKPGYYAVRVLNLKTGEMGTLRRHLRVHPKVRGPDLYARAESADTD